MSPAPHVRTFTVPPAARGARLDRWLSEQVADLSRSQVQKRIEAGDVTVNGEVPSKSGAKLEGGQIVAVRIPAPQPAMPVPEAIPLDVIYENAHALVINKPAGL